MTENSEATIEATLHSFDGIGVVRLTVRCEADIDDVWSALTNPRRLALWYGNVEGDLRAGGEFTAFVNGSQWQGRGRIDACNPPLQLRVTKWEEAGAEEIVALELVADRGHTILDVEVRGLDLDKLWAYGAGWQVLAEDLASHLAGRGCGDWSARWDDLAPSYRKMVVEPLKET